jgi:hypothetical protein
MITDADRERARKITDLYAVERPDWDKLENDILAAFAAIRADGGAKVAKEREACATLSDSLQAAEPSVVEYRQREDAYWLYEANIGAAIRARKSP